MALQKGEIQISNKSKIRTFWGWVVVEKQEHLALILIIECIYGKIPPETVGCLFLQKAFKKKILHNSQGSACHGLTF